jgi:hypothetical protein
MTKDAAQRSRWTFYEAVNHWFGVKKEKDNPVNIDRVI